MVSAEHSYANSPSIPLQNVEIRLYEGSKVVNCLTTEIDGRIPPGGLLCFYEGAINDSDSETIRWTTVVAN